MKVRSVRRSGFVACAVATVVLLGASPASADPGDGSAYGATVEVTLLGQSAVSLGPVAPSNTDGPTENSVLGIGAANILTAGVIETEAMRNDETGVVNSSATVADLSLQILGFLGTDIGADAVTATCTATQDGITGTTELVGLNLGSLGGGSANPAPNTVLDVMVGPVQVATLTLNEQISNPDGSLTVNAMHLVLIPGVLGALGTGDVVISSATCGPAAPPVPLASGAGLWIGLAAVGVFALPVGARFVRSRRAQATQAA